jgi:hypothetical protein
MTATTLGPEYLRRRIQEWRELPPPDECRRLVEACDVPIRDIADSIGVTDAAVRQWLRGERTPRGELRRRYVEAMRVLREAVDQLALDVRPAALSAEQLLRSRDAPPSTPPPPTRRAA